jgi:hypothetical protein
MFELKFRAICQDFGSNCPSALKPSGFGYHNLSLVFGERGDRRSARRTAKTLHHGLDRSAISVTAVRANQLPRAVSRAEAFPSSMLRVSMPSRPRSATVTPEMGLSQTLADGVAHAPHRL